MPYQLTTPVSDQVGILHLGGQPTFVQTTAISMSASGVITNGTIAIAAAPAGYQWCVLALAIANSAGTAQSVTLESTTGPVLLTGAISLPSSVGGQLVLPYNPAGWAYGNVADTLTLALGAGTLVTGVIVYCPFQRMS